MDVGDILGGILRIYRAAPWTLIGIWALIAGLPILFLQITTGYTVLLILQIISAPDLPSIHLDSDPFGSQAIFTGITVSLFAFFLWVFFSSMAHGALVHAVGEVIIGRVASVRNSIRVVLLKMPRIIMAHVIIIVVLILGMIILGGIAAWYEFAWYLYPVWPPVFVIIYIRYSLIVQAIVVENRSLLSSFSRSFDLTSGWWWRIFGISLVLFVIVVIISFLFGEVLFSISGNFRAIDILPFFCVLPSSLLATAVAIILEPIVPLAVTLMYFDLRVRKEGFDIEQLVRAIDTPAEK